MFHQSCPLPSGGRAIVLLLLLSPVGLCTAIHTGRDQKKDSSVVLLVTHFYTLRNGHVAHIRFTTRGHDATRRAGIIPKRAGDARKPGKGAGTEEEQTSVSADDQMMSAIGALQNMCLRTQSQVREQAAAVQDLWLAPLNTKPVQGKPRTR